MNRGSERIINVNTDGSSIKATSSNSSVAESAPAGMTR